MATPGATKRIASAVLADLLDRLGVAQDQSTADGLLDAASDVQLRRRSGIGEVVVIEIPLDPPAEKQPATPAAPTAPPR